MYDREGNKSSFIAGLLTGGVIGGIAALLFAPKSGKEFRKDIADKKDGLIDDTNYLIENAMEKSSAIILDAKKKAERLVDEGKKKVECMMKDADNLVNHGKGKFDSLTKEASDLLAQGKDKAEESLSKIKQSVK